VHGVQVLRLITSGHRDTHKLLTLEHSAGYGRGILHGGEKAQRDVEPAGFYERDTQLQSVGPAGVCIVPSVMTDLKRLRVKYRLRLRCCIRSLMYLQNVDDKQPAIAV
jgi:hypothetical protein